MKIQIQTSQQNRGSALLMSIILMGVMGFALASYLMMLQNQNQATARSLAWNSTIPIAEAGIEEALTQLKVNGTNRVANNGWTASTEYLLKTNFIGGTRYLVGITLEEPPTIFATGFQNISPSSAPISRSIRVQTRRLPLFNLGLVARNSVNLNGNHIDIDSFDSSNPLYSTNGQYDPTKRRDNASVASASGVEDYLDAGNANIRGRAIVAPGGTVKVGPNGAIGSNAWHDAGKKGVQDGSIVNDFNMDFISVEAPFTSGFEPTAGSHGNQNYDHLLTGGEYVYSKVSALSGKLAAVSGHSVLVVTSDIKMSGADAIYVAPGASLTIYMAGKSAQFGGQGIQNDSGYARNFLYYGLPSNTSLSVAGNATFTGAVYAPDAAFSLSGGGSNALDFAGAVVVKTININGKFNFHFDENLTTAQGGPIAGYVAISWDEVGTDWTAGLTGLQTAPSF